MLIAFFTVFFALLGLIFGSFLNVCLSRWPLGESIISPASHCPTCDRSLRWFENIPLLSWLFLAGRCRTCKSSISLRYPAVELLCGLLFAFQGARFATNPFLLRSDAPLTLTSSFVLHQGLLLFFFWSLLALAFFDAENFWLPDRITLPCLAAGILDSSLHPLLLTESLSFLRHGWLSHAWAVLLPDLYRQIGTVLLTAAAAGAVILLIRWSYWLLRRQEGMGLGDAKLMAMLGAWLGWRATLLSFLLGIFFATAFALYSLATTRKAQAQQQTPQSVTDDLPQTATAWSLSQLPLGTFLALGALISYFYSDRLISLYLTWVGLN